MFCPNEERPSVQHGTHAQPQEAVASNLLLFVCQESTTHIRCHLQPWIWQGTYSPWTGFCLHFCRFSDLIRFFLLHNVSIYKWHSALLVTFRWPFRTKTTANTRVFLQTAQCIKHWQSTYLHNMQFHGIPYKKTQKSGRCHQRVCLPNRWRINWYICKSVRSGAWPRHTCRNIATMHWTVAGLRRHVISKNQMERQPYISARTRIGLWNLMTNRQ